MESFRPVWSTWRPALFPYIMKACGVFRIKYISTELSEYWNDQAWYDLPLELPNPNSISSTIAQERHWEPHLSTFFIKKYKLHDFCGVATQPSLFSTAPNFVPTEPSYGVPFTVPHISPGGAGGGVVGAPAGGSATAEVRLNN